MNKARTEYEWAASQAKQAEQTFQRVVAEVNGALLVARREELASIAELCAPGSFWAEVEAQAEALLPFYIGMQQGIARLADVATDAWAARARVKQLDTELRTNTPVDREHNIDDWTLALSARLAQLARAAGVELFELPVRKPRAFEERAPRLGEVGTAVPHELAEASHAARELWKQCERRWPTDDDSTHAPEETNDAAHDAAE